MKEQLRIYRIIFLILCLPGLDPVLVSGQQSPFDPAVSAEASRIMEHVEVYTDRSMYSVNEVIRFRADYQIEGLESEKPWSSVLYVELVSPSGTSLARAKYELSDQWCTGGLRIPGSVLTGSYLLKCYTRWMRNAGSEYFSYTPLRIINPFQKEVLGQSNGSTRGTKDDRREYITGVLDCQILDTPIERGAKVNVVLSGPVNMRYQQLHCCITAVPVGTVDAAKGQWEFPRNGGNPADLRVQFLPDRQGTSLSGTVTRTNQNSEPLPYSRLHFSLLGDQPDYFAAVSDQYGRFAVTPPDRTGTQELFVSSETGDQGGIEVRIDQDFDAASVPGEALTFSLTSPERELAERMTLNMQLAEVFESTKADPLTGETDRIPFYGTPVQSLELDEWVNLPSLEEVFINLVPDVYVLKRRNKVTLKIQSGNSSIGIFEPLVMIDNIPVFDLEAVISIPPEKIRRIDVINEVYVKGSVSFGGLISIWSKNGDMAGIDLPSGSYFFDFQALEPMESRSLVQEEAYNAEAGSGQNRIPDTRNTLFWQADLELEPGTSRQIHFYAPDHPGKYLVLVRAKAGPDEILSAVATFEVR